MIEPNIEKYQMISLKTKDAIKEYGFWNVLWGTDIFINDVPFMKTLIVINILVWLLFLIK
jgi:hypothetical protein